MASGWFWLNSETSGPSLPRQLLTTFRLTIPNLGGITEFMKVAALRETHTAGLIPNFTGPVAVAAYQRAVEPGPGDAVVQIHLQHFTSAAFSYFGSVRQAGPGPRDSLIPPVACYPDGAMPAEEKNPAAG